MISKSFSPLTHYKEYTMNSRITGILYIMLSVIPISAELTSIQNKEALNSILKQHNSVVLELFTNNCGYCKQMAPILDKIQNNFSQSDIFFCKTNTPELLAYSSVSSVPTFLFFINGQLVKKAQGAMNIKVFAQLITSIFNITQNSTVQKPQ
jgi:thioredoxin 1